MKKTHALKNKTLIVGCGRLGASIANECSAEGKNIMAIDVNEACFDGLSKDFSGYTFVGDCTDLSLLEEAYITSAKEIIITVEMIVPSSYKRYIVYYGLLLSLLIFIPLFFSTMSLCKKNKWAYILVLCFFASIYQRPLVFDLIYFVIHYCWYFFGSLKRKT